MLDHELNLNYDASVRRDRHFARDAIGSSGVVVGSSAFQVLVSAAPAPLELTMGAGRMWVDGWAALAPASFDYTLQDQIDPLPAGGRALVYLDVWDQHIQPVEDASIVDPALAPVDTAARTRVGYRVRVAPTTAATCSEAWAGIQLAPISTGTMSVSLAGVGPQPNPCDPPGSAQGLMPDSLLRIEVLAQGSAANARFAWSYDNGAEAVSIRGIAGNQLTLEPSASVKFAVGDLIEVGWLARRADRRDSVGLLTVTNVVASAAGDVLTTNNPVVAPAGADGLVARRWDGETVGAAVLTNATRDGNDLGVRFVAGVGTYRPGDWWGARVRESVGVEVFAGRAPDGTSHSFAPLALVDLATRVVLSDCRRTFTPLVDLELGSSCTVVVRPGDDLQAAVDSLPPGGGEVCFAAGAYPVLAPILIGKRSNVRLVGVGPATVVSSSTGEIVFHVVDSNEVEVMDMAIRAGRPPKADEGGLNGAITFEGCRGVTVRSTHISVPDGPVRGQTGITARMNGNRRPERVTIADNALVLGNWQVGVLVTDGRDVAIERNRLSLRPPPLDIRELLGHRGVFVDEVTRLFASSVRNQPAPPRPIRLPTGTDVALASHSRVQPVVDAWIRSGQPVTASSDRIAFRRFVGSALANRGAMLAPADLRRFFPLLRDLRAVGQGIVIGGASGSAIRINDNLVAGAVQGIHVGISDAKLGIRAKVEDVLISRNDIQLTVPFTYGRDRHAIFVGNVESLQITDTRATVTRPLVVGGDRPTPINAIHLEGLFGPCMIVRSASVSGFNIGVLARWHVGVPVQRVWSISDVVASEASAVAGVDAPQFVVGIAAP
ncbi:MAG: hypothetical protein H0V07_08060 [Propionibacteriales bacterium]|nr:hypothetical protein [Propionibacteriales bacterium]